MTWGCQDEWGTLLTAISYRTMFSNWVGFNLDA